MRARELLTRTGLVVAAVSAIGLGAATVPDQAPPTAVVAAPAAPAPVAVGGPATDLDLLAVRDRDPVGYQRDAFGSAWVDTDRNGCDTRNDVLGRDLHQVTYKPGTRDCVVLTGILHDLYTGDLVPFERGIRSGEVQIDHVVALADAWRSGAHQWDQPARTRFANDPINLRAVGRAINQAKSDDTADEWTPPDPSARCDYATTVVTVKTLYRLSVSEPERAALRVALATCEAS